MNELLDCLADFVRDYEELARCAHSIPGDTLETWRARWREDEGPTGYDLVARARRLLADAGRQVEYPEPVRPRRRRGRPPKSVTT